MYQFAKYNQIELSDIKAEGWLRKWLETQRNGLTGQLGNMSRPFNTKGWGGKRQVKTERGDAWWPYEPYAYWIEAMLKVGYLIDDYDLVDKAEKTIKFVLDNPDIDGYLGPDFLKTAPDGKKNYRWPHSVFFRAVAAYHSAGGNRTEVLDALSRHYLSNTASHNSSRDVCNVESMLWLHSLTGSKELLEKALAAYEEYNRDNRDADTSLKSMRSDKKAGMHGVTFNEISKLAIIVYLASGRKSCLEAALNAYRKLDRDHMLIDGVHSSSENLNGNDILESHETCDISDFTWACGYLLMATGDASFADKIERACFNAAPGAVTKDFMNLQYFSCPNQIVSDKSSNHNIFYKGGDWMAYRPSFITPCCVGSVNRIMPNYVSRMWMRDRENGIVATFYGPSRLTAKVGRREQDVTIVEETNYPFSNVIHFQIRLPKRVSHVEFPFSFRIPGWCDSAKILVNGEKIDKSLKAGTFVKIKRSFKHNDRITVELPMKVKAIKWKNGVALERGPLLFALPVKEKRKTETTADGLKAWGRYPDSDWNYALDVNDVENDVHVVANSGGFSLWSPDEPAIELRVPARKVKNWRMIRCRETEYEEVDLQRFLNEKVIEIIRRPIKGDFHFTPPLPERILKEDLGEEEVIRLVPYGATTLRMTIFPCLSGT